MLQTNWNRLGWGLAGTRQHVPRVSVEDAQLRPLPGGTSTSTTSSTHWGCSQLGEPTQQLHTHHLCPEHWPAANCTAHKTLTVTPRQEGGLSPLNGPGVNLPPKVSFRYIHICPSELSDGSAPRTILPTLPTPASTQSLYCKEGMWRPRGEAPHGPLKSKRRDMSNGQ